MEARTTATTLTAKLPILNPEEYNLGLMRIEKYFLMTDYSLWEVIKNGNKVLTKMVGTVEQPYEPTTVKEKLDRKNEMKSRGTLLMALPNKDQLKFSFIPRCKISYGSYKEEDPQAQVKIHKIWLLYPLTAQAAQMKQITLLMEGREYRRKTVPVENPTENALITQHGFRGYDWSYQAEEEHPINFALIALTSSRSSSNLDSNVDSCSKTCLKDYATLKGQYDSLSSDYKKSQFVLLSYKAENQENVRSRSDKGYHAVLPPYIGNYIPPKPDLMFIDEQVKSESVDVVSTISSSAVKTVESVDVKSKEIEPKIEDKNVRPSIEKIKFVKIARQTEEKETNAILLIMKIMMVDLFSLEMVKVEYLEKLLDESQVLLRVPRKDNIYSVDLNSVVPTRSLTFLFAKATTDESNLWHRRLEHINYKTMNKLVRGNLVRGINREFSVARAPQQNGVAERKNRTLIEATRTMLVDSKLPTTLWAEAVNTACYVLNRALVIKPHNKTPYEPIRGRPPLINFMKPFGCPVTILNTRDYLGKFDEKDDEGFFVGHDDQVIRSEFEGLLQQERQTEHINITNSFNIVSSPVDTAGPSFANAALPSPINAAGTPASTNVFEEHPFERFSPFKNAFSLPRVPIVTPINDTEIFGNAYDDEAVEEEVDMNNVVSSYTIPDALLTKFLEDHPKNQVIGSIETIVQTRQITKLNEEHGLISSVQKLRRTNHKDFQNYLFACYLSQMEPKKLVQALKDPSWVEAMNKKDERGIVIKNKVRLVAKGHTQKEGIDYDEVFEAVVRIEAIRLFLAYVSFKDFIVYKIDVKSAFLYGKIEEEVYVCQPPGFEDPNFPDKVYKVEKALYGLHQALRALFIKRHKDDILLVHVYVDDIIFGSTRKKMIQQKSDGIFISYEKYVANILKKFGFSTAKTASTPMKPNKVLVKDAKAKDVDVHLYRSMIGSLMYITASRPDITFVVCACARFQGTPKTSHLYVVKRIFRYLKGQHKLGLWYPRDSPFDLEAYADNDYARVLWIQNKMLDYGFNLMNTKIYIDNESTICIVKNLVFHSKTKHIEIRHHFIRDSYEKKLIQVKKVNDQEHIQALVDKQKVIIMKESIKRDLKFDDVECTACLPNDTIFEELARMGAKTTAWNEFSSTMAFAIIYLANNQKLNFSKYIFDHMVKHLKGGVKFLMFPRFLQVLLDKKVEGMAKHKEIYVISSHTKKIFPNMRRQGQDFSGNVTSLFETMMVTAQEEVVKGSHFHTDSHHTPNDTQPSSSKPQKKIKPKRKQRQATEVHSPSSETPVEKSIPTPSNDPLPSGEDSFQLNDLIIFCTNLQQRVLDLEEAKIAQAKEIAKLKKRVNKLEKRRKSRPVGLRGLKKVGLSKQVESSKEKDSLGAQEDASKQGRSIEDIDQDAEIGLVDEA
nr:hypothetical protein [Tanacetum cinerariifolium]